MIGPCVKCRAQTSHTITLVMDDQETEPQFLCMTCSDAAMEGIKPWHRRFEMLLANGVSRERANEILIDMMNRGMH